MSTPAKLRQHIHYVDVASDGTRLAWAESGAGPVLVKAANWLTHLEYEWESPVWKHWMQFFSAHFRFVRHDERGCGMSEWNDRQLTVEQWTDDLETIIDAARPAEPVTLLGISQGACGLHHLRDPPPGARGRTDSLRRLRTRSAAPRDAGQGARLPRRWSTSRAPTGGTTTRPSGRCSRRDSFRAAAPEQLQWFNELCLKTTSARDRGQAAGGARRDGHLRVTRGCAHADACPARA